LTIGKKYVYSFGAGTADGDGGMRDTLGGKGAGLAEMARAQVPVPPGFTVSTEVCNVYLQNNRAVSEEVNQQMLDALNLLEERMGQRLGDTSNPLLVSVRSGAKFPMPGMADTILNLGLNDETVKALEAMSNNPRFAYDCYRRFIQMYGNVVLGVGKHDFDEVFDGQKRKAKTKLDTDLTAADLQEVIVGYKKLVQKKTGKPFPQDAMQQLAGARDAVFRSWFNDRANYYRKMNGIPDDLGTAVNVQAMVFGNLGETSATGVGFTRNPATGEKAFYGEFLENAQGEDVVAGIHTPHPVSDLEKWNPGVHKQLHEITSKLEKHYRDVQDFEYTIQDGKLYMLQTRNGKRTGPAAVRIAVDMVDEGLISPEEALLRVDPQQLGQCLAAQMAETSRRTLPKLARGLPASQGIATGRLVFSADSAVQNAGTGPVVLARVESVPDDIHGMEVSKGILTSRGGMTGHTAVVARGMGTPCVAGAEAFTIREHRAELSVIVGGSAVTLHEGDWITIDGSTGEVYSGRSEVVSPDVSLGPLGRFLAWADQHRTLRVRANADIPRDAEAARRFGAEGIGLCRTEHMFFAEDRIEHMQAMIFARDEKSRRKALAKLLPLQRRDFAALFEAMDGFPVAIRTLDPPLHEFLPTREDLMVDVAILPYADIKKKKEMAAKYQKFGIEVKNLKTLLPILLHRVEELHEFNPMLGHRGCRLGVTYPEIIELQTRAIFEGAVQMAKKGKRVIPQVMIPLIGGLKELENQTSIVKQVAEAILAKAGMGDMRWMVGAMIEIPRAALTAGELAREAQFFSFGTNDLTQTTMGLSRDDYTKFQWDYQHRKIFANDPFAVLDQEGVGQLVRMAVENGRRTRKDLEVGICGEHGGEPSSVQFCYQVGMDYVSCSPYRVPIARLAAAQAVLAKR
jgi:pyruvate,orthophosphate dikinase